MMLQSTKQVNRTQKLCKPLTHIKKGKNLKTYTNQINRVTLKSQLQAENVQIVCQVSL